MSRSTIVQISLSKILSITVTIHGHYTSSSCQTMPNIKTQKPKSQSLGVLGVF